VIVRPKGLVEKEFAVARGPQGDNLQLYPQGIVLALEAGKSIPDYPEGITLIVGIETIDYIFVFVE
jgi:hypothetical protein